MAHFGVERAIGQRAHEIDQRRGGADGVLIGLQAVNQFGMSHVSLLIGGRIGAFEQPIQRMRTTASTATAPCAQTINGLTSASTTAGSSTSRDSATIAAASAAISPAGRPR